MIRPIVGSEKPISTPVEEIEKGLTEVKLYPNPARDRLFVKLLEANYDDYEYTLFSQVGQRLKYGVLEPSISLDGLINGTYFVQLRNVDTNQIERRKLIIIK